MTRTLALIAALGLIVLGAGSAFAAEGDFNADGTVDAADQALLTAALGSADGDPNYVVDYDLDGDGVITLQDVGYFLRLGN